MSSNAKSSTGSHRSGLNRSETIPSGGAGATKSQPNSPRTVGSAAVGWLPVTRCDNLIQTVTMWARLVSAMAERRGTFDRQEAYSRLYEVMQTDRPLAERLH